MTTKQAKQKKQEQALPPHTIELEEGVLGAILIDQREFYDVTDLLSPGKFYSAKCRAVWTAFEHVMEKHGGLDLLLLSDRLQDTDPNLFDPGPESYLIGLLNAPAAIRAVDAREYAQVIHEKFIRRQMIQTGGKIASLGWDESEPVEIALERAESAALSMDPGSISYREDLPEVYTGNVIDQILARQDDEDKIPGFPTGIQEIDRALGGLRRGRYVTVGARPGMGKTAFLLNIARINALRHGKRVLFFGAEANREENAFRIISQDARIDHRKIDRGYMNDDERALALEAAGRLGESRLFLAHTPYLTPTAMRKTARRIHAQHGLDLLMIDYLQLMTVENVYGMNENARLTEISQAVKALAGELDVAIVAAAQLSRAVENRAGQKKPELADLRGSGSIEQDSDVVMFIYRDDYYNGAASPSPGLAEFLIPKNRQGEARPEGIEARWIGRFMIFEDYGAAAKTKEKQAKVYAGNGHGPNGHGEPAPINL